ncbi:hypothetical protein [Shimia sp.]|uniref:hypothetical protein n=1 Tax=Shimia sp. TaxID=1954381 RepID=UPI003BACAF8E
MPDLDSGHYFLTTLAPIRDSAAGEHTHTSYTQTARIALAKMPPALQSPATQKSGKNSPFARNTRTHFARMFVLNDAVYNGRVGKRFRGDPIDPQHVDRLNTSYVVFCADIDAIAEDGAPLPAELSRAEHKEVRAAYARTLWNTMEAELRAVYCNCEGFDGVQSADDFALYLDKCHVETTMPFHDYYLNLPDFHHLPLRRLIALVAVPLLFALLGLLLRLIGVMDMPLLPISTFWAFIGGLLAAVLMAAAAVWYVCQNGKKPLPPAEYDDLPSVLKALYLQQKFADFAVDTQGADPEELHAQFGAFLAAHQPANKTAPTQPPGTIAAPKP